MKYPQSIRSLIADLADRKNWSRKLKLYHVFEIWNALVGEDLARRARPHLIRGTVLWLNVCDSVWMQQLHLQKRLLLSKVNQELDGVELTDIRFQLDVSLDQDGQDMEVKAKPLPRKEPPPVLEDFPELGQSLKGIHDPEIRQAIADCWQKIESARRSS